MPIYLIAHRKLETDSRVPRKARMIWKKIATPKNAILLVQIKLNVVIFSIFS